MAVAAAVGLQGNIPFPPKLDMKGPLATNWKRWKQIWDSFEIVSKLKNADKEYRTATFITCIGPDAMDVFNGLPFANEGEKKDIDKVIELMDKFCIGETNELYESYIFNTRGQEPGESIDGYITALRTLAETCNFDVSKDRLIRDRIVAGVRDNGVRRKLLQESSALTLTKCIDICRAAESTAEKAKAMGRDEDEVHVAYQKPARASTSEVNCKFCGNTHRYGKRFCPASGKR
jgi:hypothetical protein